MSGFVYALVLMGCSDAGDMCDRLAGKPALYRDQIACMADIDGALRSDRALRADWPTVVATCRTATAEAETRHADPRLARVSAPMR